MANSFIWQLEYRRYRRLFLDNAVRSVMQSNAEHHRREEYLWRQRQQDQWKIHNKTALFSDHKLLIICYGILAAVL